jgi:hypothetical protein
MTAVCGGFPSAVPGEDPHGAVADIGVEVLAGRQEGDGGGGVTCLG